MKKRPPTEAVLIQCNQCMILPATSQRARYSQASFSVSTRFTRPFSYATTPCQNALNAPFAARSTRLLGFLITSVMTRLPSYNYGRNHQPRWAYPMVATTSGVVWVAGTVERPEQCAAHGLYLI